jgi:hypothetical protein
LEITEEPVQFTHVRPGETLLPGGRIITVSRERGSGMAAE